MNPRQPSSLTQCTTEDTHTTLHADTSQVLGFVHAVQASSCLSRTGVQWRSIYYHLTARATSANWSRSYFSSSSHFGMWPCNRNNIHTISSCQILLNAVHEIQAVTPLCGGIACTRPSVRPRKPRLWCVITILACPPLPEPSSPARSRSVLSACRPSVHA